MINATFVTKDQRELTAEEAVIELLQRVSALEADLSRTKERLEWFERAGA